MRYQTEVRSTVIAHGHPLVGADVEVSELDMQKILGVGTVVEVLHRSDRSDATVVVRSGRVEQVPLYVLRVIRPRSVCGLFGEGKQDV